MDILILLIFVSLVLVIGALLFFAKAVQNEDFDHTEQLSLLPFEEENHAEEDHNL